METQSTGLKILTFWLRALFLVQMKRTRFIAFPLY